ncbi:ras-related protein Rab-10-like isoform X1 [Rhinatrema bivittatum]|uniref:ras-related protein Rab-10-like isoform X1 n=1 Tax=Rhinatrema bivittatum TaxID=194408 RepID=UPI00112D1B2B|nr:ras-related protein Rab-10-like isoform X1 [Rhinatrema bivittatum]
MAHSQPLKCLSVKLVMAGDSWVGKTSILRRYTGDSDPSLISTIGIDFRIKTVTIDETMLKLQIWDTAGQERFHTLSVSYFRGAHGFVLVYDITNSDSFKNVEYWMKDIQKKGDDVEIILLGNKCDKEDVRVISKEKGEKLAWEYGIPFFETSAKNNINIDQAFSVLVEGIFGKKASLQLATNVVTLRERKRKDACCNT